MHAQNKVETRQRDKIIFAVGKPQLQALAAKKLCHSKFSIIETMTQLVCLL